MSYAAFYVEGGLPQLTFGDFMGNVCPANSYLGTESYGQEMSAGDPLYIRKVIKQIPHKPPRDRVICWIHGTEFFICADCSALVKNPK